MGELFTRADLERILRKEVADAGGAKKWLRKNKIFGWDHVLPMISSGRAACSQGIIEALGFRSVERFEEIQKQAETDPHD